MDFTIQQRKEAYKKLSSEIQDFIMSNETTELISALITESGLSGENADTADSEVLYAMLGLQTLSTTISNIASVSGKNVNDLSKLKSDLENKIFSKIKQEVKTEQPKENFINKMEGNKSKADLIRKSKDQKEIADGLTKLPQSLQSYINGGVWKQSVGKIGTQLNLKQDAIAKLENEVFLVLICLEPPSDFVENLKREVVVDESTARTISNYINGTVFGVVMKDIKLSWAPNNSSKQSAVSSQDEKEWSKPNFQNMAKAMGVDMPPDNLPIGDGPRVTERVIHNYNTKADPYRELPE